MLNRRISQQTNELVERGPNIKGISEILEKYIPNKNEIS